MITLHEECVALLLGDDLNLAYVACRDDGDLIFGLDIFKDAGWGGFMGFHDWLRAPNQRTEIVGVRFWPHEVSSIPSAIIAGKAYVSSCNNGRGIIVWFKDCHEHDAATSGDQSFRVSRVMSSRATDRLVLVLDQDDLTAGELESVRSIVGREAARWAE